MRRRTGNRLHSPRSALERTQGKARPDRRNPRPRSDPSRATGRAALRPTTRPNDRPTTRSASSGASSAKPLLTQPGRRVVETAGEGSGRSFIQQRRFLALNLTWIVLFGLILVPMVQLQVTQPEKFVDLARKQRIRSVSIKPERGDLVDRLGVPLAISEREWRIVADPKIIGATATIEATAKQLALEFGVNVPYLRERMRLSKRYVPLIEGVNEQSMLRVQILNLPGISLEETPRRVYPAGDVARSVLGRVGRVDHTGISGLEEEFDMDLRGTEGTLLAERARWGRQIAAGERQVVPAKRGTTYVLTIDSALNYATDGMLAQAIANSSAKGGTLVVADVRNGDVLALSSMRVSPTGEVRPSEDNQALVSVFEPGSTNKVITIAAALEEGVVGPYSEIRVPDRLTVADHRFKDDEPHAPKVWTPGDILAESSNIGTIKIAQALRSKTLDRYLRGFGLGEKTTINFPGESRGLLLPVNKWTGTSIGTVPIGQGLAVTSMQMLNVYATIANGGERIPLRLVRGTVDANGKEHPAPIGRSYRVVSKKTSDLVTTMLESVVANGTGIKAQVTGYSVAGKTGTAQKPNVRSRGYQTDAYVASFAGFFPSQSPRLAIIAVLDEPKTSIYGGAVAAPLFAEVALFAGQHYRIPPSSGSEVRVTGTTPASVSVKNAEMRAVEKAGTWQSAAIRRAAIASPNLAVAPRSANTPVPSATVPQAPTATRSSASVPATVAPPRTVPPPTQAPTTTVATIPDVSRRGKEAPLPPRAVVVAATTLPRTTQQRTTQQRTATRQSTTREVPATATLVNPVVLAKDPVAIAGAAGTAGTAGTVQARTEAGTQAVTAVE